jgi:hypothetical protein
MQYLLVQNIPTLGKISHFLNAFKNAFQVHLKNAFKKMLLKVHF